MGLSLMAGQATWSCYSVPWLGNIRVHTISDAQCMHEVQKLCYWGKNENQFIGYI